MRGFNSRLVTVAVSAAMVSGIAWTALRRGAGHSVESLFQIGGTGTSSVTVVVDGTVRYQTIEGFGQAEPSTLVYPGPQTLSDSLRAIAVDKAFNQVGINMGIIGNLLESPSDWSQLQNDNGDPFSITWSGFSAASLNATKQYVVDWAKPYGFSNYYLGAEAPNVRWASPWLADVRNRDYNLYLDEVAEQVLANVTFWKNTYGEELPYYQLGNEQMSGNKAMINPDQSGYGPIDPLQQMVDITKRSGAILQRMGFLNTRFMVGTEETEEMSLKVATAILSDPDARPYVGAIGYHSYPYGEGYSSSTFILGTSGAGNPDASRVAVRNRLRDLGANYNVNVWITENSNAGEPLSYDTFRARAIQIHDEFLYANASAYFGEASMWDLASQRLHFENDNLYTIGSEGNIVLINNDTGAVDITAIGYAIGHYARWVKRGSIRVDATSSDPLVQVSAFRNDNQGRAALVLINNAPIPRTLTISLTGLSITGNLAGEQSTALGYWKPIAAVAPSSATTFTISLPQTSVTSIGWCSSAGNGQR